MVVASALVGSVSTYARPDRPKSQSTRCTSTSREGTRDAGLMTLTTDDTGISLISVLPQVNDQSIAAGRTMTFPRHERGDRAVQCHF